MKAIIDSGVLIALMIGKDKHHLWAKDVVAHYAPPFITCESVLSETQFIVSKLSQKPFDVADLVVSNFVTIKEVFDKGASTISAFLKKYADLPASLADASVVYLSEQHSKLDLLSTDSDFSIYRRSNRSQVPCVFPPGVQRGRRH